MNAKKSRVSRGWRGRAGTGPARAGQGLRRRGFTLVEVVLALGVALGLIGLYAGMIRDEQHRQERMLIASEQSQVLAASRAYVSQRYDALRERIFAAAPASANLGIVSIPMSDLVGDGYLPPSFSTGSVLKSLKGQDYALVARAVRRNDATATKATMSRVLMDPGTTGSIDPALMDGRADNDEMDVEALLVTYGGDPVRRGDAGDIIARMNSSFGGSVTVANRTNGLYGSFDMVITPFNSLATYPTVGRFASIVSLSSFGALDGDDEMLDPLRRCDGVDTGSDDWQACLASNEVYTDVILRPFDSDNDGTADVFPALRGLSRVTCDPDDTTAGDATALVIDCSTTTVSGNFTVEGDDVTLGKMDIDADSIEFGAGTLAELRTIGGDEKLVATPDKLVLDDLNGGQDMSEAIIGSEVKRAGELVTKPQCPLVSASGNTMEPRIYISPVSYQDPHGRPVVGVRSFAENVSLTEWRIRTFAFVGQDYCTNDITSALPTSVYQSQTFPASFPIPNQTKMLPNSGMCSTWDSDGTVAIDRSDSLSDVYELGTDDAVVIAQTRCY